jgi:ArsR family transcriptional regulator
MPFDDSDLAPGGDLLVRVEASAASELVWVLLYLTGSKRGPLDGPAAGLPDRFPELAARARAFWADGVTCDTEVFVLAHRSGTLLDADADAFLDRLDATARAGGPDPGLLSETPEERARLQERLERLQGDATVRRELERLLRDTWAAVRPDWDREGRAAVLAACETFRARLRTGTDPRALLPAGHIAGKAPWDALFRDGVRRGATVFSPCWFIGGRGHIVELEGSIHLALALPEEDQVERLRAQAERISGRLKVLSDPTRVAILSQLAVEPLSVTELATRFGLSQPTVSNHVRMLREAQLLDARKDGGRTAYVATRARVQRLLDDAGSLLLAGCAT